jgi:transposase InsO family protein
MDFFAVPTLTGRVLIVLAHHRRRIVHLNITEHPTAAWSAQQVVDAFPEDTARRWMHRDRDRIYGDVFQRRLASMGIAEVVSAPASPWQNPYAERLIRSVRRECLNHVIVLASGTCDVSCPRISSTTMGRERISLSRRTHPGHDASTRRRKVAWWRSRKWVDFTIATNAAQPEVLSRSAGRR